MIDSAARLTRRLRHDSDIPGFALSAARSAADRLQFIHDARLVWAFALQGDATSLGDPGELGDRLRRVLPRGPGEPLWQRRLHDGTAKDYAGSDHAPRVRRIFRG